MKRYEGKIVYIELKSGRKYSGQVLEVEPGEYEDLITIKDKFSKYVSFSSNDVNLIEEEGE